MINEIKEIYNNSPRKTEKFSLIKVDRVYKQELVTHSHITRYHLRLANFVIAIIYSDSLASTPYLKCFWLSEDKQNELYELNQQIGYMGSYENIISNYDFTLKPKLQLKIYLEALHQTNIPLCVLEQILEDTKELKKMWLNDTTTYMLKRVVEFKESYLNTFSANPYEHPYPFLPITYPSPQELKTLKPEELMRALEGLQQEFKEFENILDKRFNNSNQPIDLILKSFGSEEVRLFREIFAFIANHPKSTPKVKKEAEQLLIQVGGALEEASNYTR